MFILIPEELTVQEIGYPPFAVRVETLFLRPIELRLQILNHPASPKQGIHRKYIKLGDHHGVSISSAHPRASRKGAPKHCFLFFSGRFRLSISTTLLWLGSCRFRGARRPLIVNFSVPSEQKTKNLSRGPLRGAPNPLALDQTFSRVKRFDRGDRHEQQVKR